MKYLVIGSRVLLGLAFVIFGLNGFLGFLEPPPLEDQAAAFMGTLISSKYLYVVKILEIVSGALLLLGKKIPLALVLATPIVVNILLFHIFLNLQGLPIAVVLTVLNAILIWDKKLVFTPVLVAN